MLSLKELLEVEGSRTEERHGWQVEQQDSESTEYTVYMITQETTVHRTRREFRLYPWAPGYHSAFRTGD